MNIDSNKCVKDLKCNYSEQKREKSVKFYLNSRITENYVKFTQKLINTRFILFL